MGAGWATMFLAERIRKRRNESGGGKLLIIALLNLLAKTFY
jgi:hypothetical protein